MTLALVFWVLMLLWLVLGFVWPSGEGRARYFPWLMHFLLFAVLGWAVFGSPIAG